MWRNLPASEVLRQLERLNRHSPLDNAGEEPAGNTKKGKKTAAGCPEMQMTFFQLDDPVLSQIRDEILHLDIDNLSPLQALNKLSDIRGILTGK